MRDTGSGTSLICKNSTMLIDDVPATTTTSYYCYLIVRLTIHLSNQSYGTDIERLVLVCLLLEGPTSFFVATASSILNTASLWSRIHERKDPELLPSLNSGTIV